MICWDVFFMLPKASSINENGSGQVVNWSTWSTNGLSDTMIPWNMYVDLLNLLNLIEPKFSHFISFHFSLSQFVCHFCQALQRRFWLTTQCGNRFKHAFPLLWNSLGTRQSSLVESSSSFGLRRGVVVAFTSTFV